MILATFSRLFPFLDGLSPRLEPQTATSRGVYRAEFPRAMAASLVLLLFIIMLFIFAVQIALTLLLHAGVPQEGPGSFLWLTAYALANVLFLIQAAVYFTGFERLELHEDCLIHIQGVGPLMLSKRIPLDSILASGLQPGLLVACKIDLLIESSERNTRVTVGRLFGTEEAEQISERIKHSILLADSSLATPETKTRIGWYA